MTGLCLVRIEITEWFLVFSLDMNQSCFCGVSSVGVMRAPLCWVLWDVKDTLLKVRASVGEQYCKEAKRVGLNLNPVEVEAAFLKAYRHHSSRSPNYGISQGLDGRSWWIRVVRDTFSQCRVQDPALLNAMAHNLYYSFCDAENWEVKDWSHTLHTHRINNNWKC